MKHKYCLILFFLCVCAVSASGQTKHFVFSSKIAIREQPSSTAKILFYCQQGLTLNVQSEEQGWDKVSFLAGKYVGWVENKNVTTDTDWQKTHRPYNPTTDGWIPFNMDLREGVMYVQFYNPAKLVKTNPSIRCWTMEIDLADEKQTLVRMEIDCQNSEMRFLSEAVYSSRGGSPITTDFEQLNPKMDAIIPGSRAEGLMEKVCSLK